jgi:hypothetical protein
MGIRPKRIEVHVLCVCVGILPAPSVELRELPARPNIGSDTRDPSHFVRPIVATTNLRRG